MKKWVSILVTVCAAMVSVFFFVLAGGSFLQMFSGPMPLMDGTDFAEVEGKYISYGAVHPVASYNEECYSGDQNRVSKYGFVVYDRELKVFLYVIVPDQNKYDFQRVMRELRTSDVSKTVPITVKGTLTRMNIGTVEHALKALADRRTPDEELAAVWDELVQTQKDWYMIEHGVVSGIAEMDVWWCILAAGLSLLIFMCRIFRLVAGEKEEKGKLTENFESPMEQFLVIQRAHVMEWCRHVRNRTEKSLYLCVLCVTAGLMLIGFLAKYSPLEILVRHFPMGVFFGEIFALFCWSLLKARSDWKKMLKRIRKDIDKVFPSAGAQDAFVQDYLASCEEWAYEGAYKDTLAYGVLGDRYWTSVSANGNVTIIDVNRLNRVDTFVDTGRVSYGKYRGRYFFYTVKFFLRDEQDMVYERSCIFPSQKTMDEFAQLARRKAGDRIEVIEK